MTEEQLKIINDYYIQYGGDEELFDLHKPSDIRCLIDLLNCALCRQEKIIKNLTTKRDLLVQKKNRYFRLYELKDAEVTARVDGLNKICNYYLTEAQFKADTDPNQAVKEVINEILNTEVEK